MYPVGFCSERWTSRVTYQGLLSFKFQLSLLGHIQLSCHWGASSYFSFQENLPYVPSTHTLWIFWGLAGWKLRLRPLRFFYVQLLVSQTSHLIYVVLWTPRHDIAARMSLCIQHLVEPGGHPSNYEPGPALLNFSDRADTDELTPYSVFDKLQSADCYKTKCSV